MPFPTLESISKPHNSSSTKTMELPKPHVILLASPGMGHLIPVLELGKRFVSQHDFQVTVFVVSTDASTVASQIHSQNLTENDLFNVVCLPHVDTSQDASFPDRIFFMMHQSVPALRSAISEMKPHPTAIIVDLFGTEAMSLADEFNMLCYMFIASNAWFLASMVYAPALDEKALEEHANGKQPIRIPGCSPIRFEDALEPFYDVKAPMFQDFLLGCLAITSCDGILVNSWEDLEPRTLAAFGNSRLLARVAKAPVYAIGPVIRPVPHWVENESSHDVLKWLDTKPDGSVLLVSFGSGGALSSEQMMELALGLELSEQRFVWIVRPPVDDDVMKSYLKGGSDLDQVEDYLPKGFSNRIENVGFVIPMWGPQTEILRHPSVGGFLSHCGWNSVLESISNDVPMIGWPLFAEQKMNATMLTEDLGVAVRIKVSAPNGIVTRDEINTVVRKIMVGEDGEKLRKRVKELKLSAEKALKKGGSSSNAMSQVVEMCENNLNGKIAKARGS